MKAFTCPICGNDRTQVIQRLSLFYVMCQRGSCMTTGPGGDTEQEAIAAWNKREGPMALDERETATVLHALRIVQCEGRIEGCNAAECDHFAGLDPLTNEEIDDLCERINFYDVAAKAPTRVTS